MMKNLLLFLLLIPAVAHSEDISKWPQVLMPGGEIPAGAKVQAKPLPTGDSVVATPEAARPLAVQENSKYLRVTSIESNQIAATDQADLNSQLTNGTLRVATGDLNAGAICATATDGSQVCQTRTAIPLAVASPTNPNYVYPALAAPSTMAAPLTNTAGLSGDNSGMAALIASMTSSMGQTQSTGTQTNSSYSSGGGSSSAICDTNTSARNTVSMLKGSDGPANIQQLSNDISGAPPACGLRQAQEAFQKARASGKVTQDIMIVNDFKTGAAKGKMYFVHADGTMAKDVGIPNPIEVARGDGGFGNGGGSGRTPNGAIYTGPYRPPRAGNVKDGIDLYGLEPGNKDITGRGVLLHGWNPNSVTHGCLGIPGRLTTGRGSRSFGNYLDILKSKLLKNGGVLIYNFTPQKASQCSS